MKWSMFTAQQFRFTLALAAAVILSTSIFGHCDTMSGPVVVEAKAALEKGDVTPLLKWIAPADEDAVKKAFDRAVSMKDKGPEIKEMAELYFLETLVRLHRQSEGEPYTGLKSEAVSGEVAMGDRAVETGDPSELQKELEKRMKAGLKEKFDAVTEAAKHKGHNVEAGRAYVRAYVEYIHYVDRLFGDIAGAGPHKCGEKKEPAETTEKTPHKCGK